MLLIERRGWTEVLNIENHNPNSQKKLNLGGKKE